jgi:UDP-3-O-[3-hydroxymyristoyl] glucosamine N-acyltransferase
MMDQRTYTLRELADLIGGEIAGDDAVVIKGAAGIEEAREGDVTVLSDARYEKFLATTGASAVIRPKGVECAHPSIVSEKPQLAWIKILGIFAHFTDAETSPGAHPTALVDPTAAIGERVSIGPFCWIGREARIGAGTRVLPGSFVGDRVTLGRDCLIYPNVTIRESSEIGDRVILHPGVVIGADGFGFAWDGERHVKIPQIGRVVIEDDVEIGANSAVDRATTVVTRVCRGSKIDNLVQVGHNCVVGRNSILSGQTGLAGSTVLGQGVIVGGQTGFMGHITVGDGVVIAAQTGVTKSVPPGVTLSGFPAREHGLARRIYACMTRLPELFQRVKALEGALAARNKEKKDD